MQSAFLLLLLGRFHPDAYWWPLTAGSKSAFIYQHLSLWIAKERTEL